MFAVYYFVKAPDLSDSLQSSSVQSIDSNTEVGTFSTVYSTKPSPPEDNTILPSTKHAKSENDKIVIIAVATAVPIFILLLIILIVLCVICCKRPHVMTVQSSMEQNPHIETTSNKDEYQHLEMETSTNHLYTDRSSDIDNSYITIIAPANDECSDPKYLVPVMTPGHCENPTQSTASRISEPPDGEYSTLDEAAIQ